MDGTENTVAMMCMWSGCGEKPTEYWYVKTDRGLVDRTFCYAHATDARGNDKSAFCDDYVPGSDEGEA